MMDGWTVPPMYKPSCEHWKNGNCHCDREINGMIVYRCEDVIEAHNCPWQDAPAPAEREDKP